MDAMSAFRPQRAISARGLAPGMAQILDELEETGHAVAVVRYGRIAAVLAPMENGSKLRRPEAWVPDMASEVEEIEDADPELSAVEGEVFEAIVQSDSGLWSPSERLVGCSGLEMGASFMLSRSGKRYAQRCADQVSVRRAAEREG